MTRSTAGTPGEADPARIRRARDSGARKPKKKDENAEHRQRLRERYLQAGLEGFAPYEVVELLLTLGQPVKNMKPAGKEAIERFGSLRGVLEAPAGELQKIKGIGPVNSIAIRLIQEVARKYLEDSIKGRLLAGSAEAVFDYLYHSMRDLKKEQFKVIYVNSQNEIIDSETLFEGTADSSAVWAREVVAGAIRKNATGLIFAHNHPSGSPEPSQSDREVTRDLVYAARIMQIKALDHIIIGDNRYFSFAADGLMERYEADFLTLKMQGTADQGHGAGGRRDVTLRRDGKEGGLPWSVSG